MVANCGIVCVDMWFLWFVVSCGFVVWCLVFCLAKQIGLLLIAFHIAVASLLYTLWENGLIVACVLCFVCVYWCIISLSSYHDVSTIK